MVISFRCFLWSQQKKKRKKKKGGRQAGQAASFQKKSQMLTQCKNNHHIASQVSCYQCAIRPRKHIQYIKIENREKYHGNKESTELCLYLPLPKLWLTSISYHESTSLGMQSVRMWVLYQRVTLQHLYSINIFNREDGYRRVFLHTLRSLGLGLENDFHAMLDKAEQLGTTEKGSYRLISIQFPIYDLLVDGRQKSADTCRSCYAQAWGMRSDCQRTPATTEDWRSNSTQRRIETWVMTAPQIYKKNIIIILGLGGLNITYFPKYRPHRCISRTHIFEAKYHHLPCIRCIVKVIRIISRTSVFRARFWHSGCGLYSGKYGTFQKWDVTCTWLPLSEEIK